MRFKIKFKSENKTVSEGFIAVPVNIVVEKFTRQQKMIQSYWVTGAWQ